MTEVGGVAAEKLKQYIERIERLEEEKLNISSDVRDIFAEAKSAGFDVKVMRQVIKARRMKEEERDVQETLFEVYKKALGMV